MINKFCLAALLHINSKGLYDNREFKVLEMLASYYMGEV